MEHNILWKSYLNDSSEENKNKIIDKINKDLKKCVDYFAEYYKNPDNLRKFKNQKNIDTLIQEINKVKVITYFKKYNSDLDTSWGYIYTNDLYTIHINYFNFFNKKINASIYDTILHEMGHLIDFMLRSLKEAPSFFEFGHMRAKTNTDKYIISREEDYARIQRLRNIFKLNPIGTYQEIADILNEYIKSKRIELGNLELEISPDKKNIIVKTNVNLSKLELTDLAYVFGNIVIDNYLATDIGYLFAKYAKVENNNILVDLVKINNINNKFVNTGFTDNGNFA
jgi:hypothetical protein